LRAFRIEPLRIVIVLAVAGIAGVLHVDVKEIYNTLFWDHHYLAQLTFFVPFASALVGALVARIVRPIVVARSADALAG
jgi:hypothetical protein